MTLLKCRWPLVLFLVATINRVRSEDNFFYYEERTISIQGGDIKVSMEKYESRKMLVAMKIPYAQPPVGNLRFMPPEPMTPWTEPRNCNRFANLTLNSCPQVNGYQKDADASSHGRKKHHDPNPDEFWTELKGGFDDFFAREMSEDCLTLNVWAPLVVAANDTDSKYPPGSLPVMVYIHGGAFTDGSANVNGMGLSESTGSIVVTFNYRLGPLGFLHTSALNDASNVGLLDQIRALEWVKANIGSFGGDANRVTIIGEEAGSASANYLLVLKSPVGPIENDLFDRAVLQSGVFTNEWAYAEPEAAERTSAQLGASVGCVDPEESIVNDSAVDCMRSVDVAGFVEAARNRHFAPTSDGATIPYPPKILLRKERERNPSEAKDVIVGFNRNDGALRLAMSKEKSFGPGVHSEGYLSGSTFAMFARNAIEEAQSRFVMDRVRKHYYRGKVGDMVELYTDHAFRCEIVKTAMALKANRLVHVYVWNVTMRFVRNAFPYMGAALGLDHSLFGRPWLNKTAYSEDERNYAAVLQSYWSKFANGSSQPFDRDIHYGNAFVLNGSYLRAVDDRQEPIDMRNCEFLDCLPSLAKLERDKYLDDASCAKFALAAASVNVASLVSLIISIVATVCAMKIAF